MRSRAARLSVAVILIAGVLASASARPADASNRNPGRVAGADRYATAVGLAQTGYPTGTGTVFLASGEAFPDGLAGGAIAGANHGPLLLTAPTALPDVVAAELRRLAPRAVGVVGGTEAISEDVVAQIAAATGVSVTRYAGMTRYDTAASLATVYPAGGRVFVATGTGFADGLAGGAAAALAGRPLLLVDPDMVPPATSAQLDRLTPSEVIVLGGPAAVSDAVLDVLRRSSPNVRRIAGLDRFGTAAAVAQEFFPNGNEALMASGIEFPDALAAGPIAAKLGSALVLSLPACVPPPTTAWFQLRAWPNLTVIGGPAALSDDALAVKPCSPVPDGPVGPGARLDTVVTDGPNVVRIITLDRGQGLAVRSSLATGKLVGRLRTTAIARQWNAVVAVNGDFFLANGEPAHAFATGGRMLKAPALVEDQIGFRATNPHSAYFGTPQFAMSATVQETGVPIPIEGINDGTPAPNETALYTPEGAGAAAPPSSGTCAARLPPAAAPELDVNGNAVQLHTVAAVGCGASAPSGGADDLLVATQGGSRAGLVSALAAGQHVRIRWKAQPQWPDLLDTIGSNTTLVHNGAPSDDVVLGSGPYYDATAPRTAVGALADGREVLVTVDGRQPGYSIGMTPLQLAQFMTSIGVKEAAGLDGGGSTTLVVNGLLVNRPSDAAGERAVGSALVVVPSGTPDPVRASAMSSAQMSSAAASTAAPTPDALVASDAGSLGGYAATLAARGVPLGPEMAALAAAFRRSADPGG